MPCYSPGRSKSGQVVSCGQCKFCRLKYAGEWSTRCVHEASLYQENCFITLTYDDKRLPAGYDIRQGLVYEHFNIHFMKSLRDRCGGLTKVKHHNFGKINSKTGKPYPEFHRPIRFYMSGEYGSKFSRPHWHACIFNFDFSDKYFWRMSKEGFPVYRSPTLEELWPYGNSEIGSVTVQSAGYCARYIMKKVTGDNAVKHYQIFDPETGQYFDRRPEFSKQSLRPGIGEGWFRKYYSDVYPQDNVILRDGRKVKPPRYYDKKFFQMTKVLLPVCPFFDSETGEVFEDYVSPELDNIKHVRMAKVKEKLDKNGSPSLNDERQYVERTVKLLKRSLHD